MDKLCESMLLNATINNIYNLFDTTTSLVCCDGVIIELCDIVLLCNTFYQKTSQIVPIEFDSVIVKYFADFLCTKKLPVFFYSTNPSFQVDYNYNLSNAEIALKLIIISDNLCV